MQTDRPLAFLDLETTGLGATAHRIAEIGVVTLEDGRAQEWGTLVNPGRLGGGQRILEGVEDAQFAAAPRFAEIARGLARRLEGRLLVAHNARFDYAFLKAEFARAGIAFETPALCTVMLSRKLYPAHASHSLDALIERHGLECQARHRALADARALHHFWQVLRREFPARRLWAAVGKLLAEPLLPPHLDASLISALPERPGVYVLRGNDRRALRIARAANLRREVRAYFRLDRISGKGARIAYEVREIEAHPSEGDLSARLHETALRAKEPEAGYARCAGFTIRIDPATAQVAEVLPASDLVARREGLCGLFDSERKAKNALARLAARQGLCHAVLGLPPDSCAHCAPQQHCGTSRAQHLVRALTAMTALRLQPWPYAGPVGVREGRTVHVFDQWQWVGSAKTAGEIAELLELRPTAFDAGVFKVLNKALPRLPPTRLKTLRRAANGRDDPVRAV